MAYVGEWGTFIHIPKTGGTSIRAGLERAFGAGNEIGPHHGVPKTKYERPWVVIRHPAYYLRSLYAWRDRYGWVLHEKGGTQWKQTQDMLEIYKGMDWGSFVEEYTACQPGLVGRILALYEVEGLRVFRIEYPSELYAYLGKYLALPHANGNKSARAMGLSYDIVRQIERAEPEIMDRYYPSYLW